MHHLIIYVPITHAAQVRDALARSGAGKIGNYDSCSFSSKGIGRFRPLKGSKPFVGSEGKIEEVEEERIEVVAPDDVDLKKLLAEVRKAHPYEEPAIHVLPMHSLTSPPQPPLHGVERGGELQRAGVR